MMNTRKIKTRRITRAVGVLAALAFVTASCGGDDDAVVVPPADTDAPSDDMTADTSGDMTADTADMSDDTSDMSGDMTADTSDMTGDMTEECDTPREMSLQMQWVTQAQFAGYYAAMDQGFFENHCLDVTILEGGVDIVPQTQLANGDADFAISWVSKALASREAGADIVDIAQIYQRSGTLQVAFADSGITTPADFAGKKIGNWGYGNEYEVFAALGAAGLDPANDVELVGQDFTMVALLEGDIDAAEAMTYNEYAQLLEAVNPDTGELYQPEDFNVINYTDEGVGMLQDAIWADADKLANDPDYRSLAVSFVAASIEGWMYCRDNVESCVDIVLASGPTLGASHQLWQMNEVNKLIWPSDGGIGYIDPAAWDRTVEIAQGTPNLEGATVLTAAPTEGAYTNDIIEEAWTHVQTADADTIGAGWSPIDVALNEGGN
jgi:NitT/TauT family transport system substrate-binding protein